MIAEKSTHTPVVTQREEVEEVAQTADIVQREEVGEATHTSDSIERRNLKKSSCTALKSNVISHLLIKSERGKLIVAAYNYDLKFKNSKQFAEWSYKLSDFIIENEYFRGNSE